MGCHKVTTIPVKLVWTTEKRADSELPHGQTIPCSRSPSLKPSMQLIHQGPPVGGQSKTLQVCSGPLKWLQGDGQTIVNSRPSPRLVLHQWWCR